MKKLITLGLLTLTLVTGCGTPTGVGDVNAPPRWPTHSEDYPLIFELNNYKDGCWEVEDLVEVINFKSLQINSLPWWDVKCGESSFSFATALYSTHTNCPEYYDLNWLGLRHFDFPTGNMEIEFLYTDIVGDLDGWSVDIFGYFDETTRTFNISISEPVYCGSN